MNVLADKKTTTEQRAARRCHYTAPLSVSYFNEVTFHDAQTINHSPDGMCLKSSFFFKPGATICIRVKKFHPDGHPCTGLCEGLHSVCLAEIKWCEEVPDSDSYRLGVKYLKADY